jgi:hypothetical protein
VKHTSTTHFFDTLLFNKQTQILGYAEDIDIIGRSQAAIREAFLALEREANKVGLKINESKTKYMIVAGNERTICDIGQSVVTPNNDVSLEIQRRIQTANRCFFGLRKHCSRGICHVQQN